MFKISIIEVTKVQKPYEQEWRQLHDQEDTKGHPQRGYVTAPGTREVSEERQVLAQTIDKLDLVAVIKAVNGIAS